MKGGRKIHLYHNSNGSVSCRLYDNNISNKFFDSEISTVDLNYLLETIPDFLEILKQKEKDRKAKRILELEKELAELKKEE